MKVKPVPASTNGYCQEIFVFENRERPPWTRNETIGISSYHRSVLPVTAQIERPPSPRPVPWRQMTTFKKLPMIVPKIKIQMKNKGSTLSIITGSKPNLLLYARTVLAYFLKTVNCERRQTQLKNWLLPSILTAFTAIPFEKKSPAKPDESTQK